MNKKIEIDQDKGLLNIAEFLASPNCNERPVGMMVDMVVIHNISLPPGEFGTEGIEQFFLNKLDCSLHPYYHQISNLKVSAHLLITRKGLIKQFVPFHLRAWHAGDSCFGGRADCNDFSIGIELEGTDRVPYTNIQYHLLSKVCSALIKCYPGISFQRIVGHYTIAPKRKTDPGQAFDWRYFFELLEKEIQHEIHHSTHLSSHASNAEYQPKRD